MNAYGVMTGVLIGSLVTLALLYLAAYLPVLNPAVGCTWSVCHIALSCVSAAVLRRVLSSNNKVGDF